MRKLSLFRTVLVIVLILFLLAGCGFMMKTVGKVVGGMLTGKTADLSQVSAQVSFVRNVFPKETNTFEVQFFSDDWREGHNMVAVNFFNRDGVGMMSIDGKVIIEGEEVPHMMNGFYGKWVDKNDLSPKTVRIETTTGQKAEFVVSLPPPIKIVSVNGKKEDSEIDLGSEMILQLESKDVQKDSKFSIAFLDKVMGMRSFVDKATLNYNDKVTIPPEVWANSGKVSAGENWLRVERFNLNVDKVKGVGAAQVVGSSIDCIPVNITGKAKSGKGDIRLKYKVDTDDGPMKINFFKPMPFLGRPMSSGKKFALASFTLRATLKKEVETTDFYSMRQFPELPDVFWEDLLHKLYNDFEKIIHDNYDMTFIPIEQVKQAPSYKDLQPITDKVTKVEAEKSYKGTKNLIPTNIEEMLDNISSTFASDRVDSRLIRELGVDGIVAVTIDLEMPPIHQDEKKFSLQPKLSLRISGGPYGYKTGPTIYQQGIVTGEGVEFEEAKLNAEDLMDILPRVMRRKALMQALDIALKDMAEQEKEGDYETLWALN